MQIVPMRDLKDTVKIERLCDEENGPVFVTKNGYGKLVVMNIEYYEQTIKKMYEAANIQTGINDINNGKVVDGESVLTKMRNKYGIWV